MNRIFGSIKRAINGILINTYEGYLPIPSNITSHQIATSTNNNEVHCYTIGSGKNHILFVSAIHGNEVGTVKLAHILISWLYTHYREYPECTFYVVPVLNPDGFSLAKKHPDYWRGGRVGRFNGHNVDLNRNFTTPSFQSTSVWTHGKNYQEKTTVFCGEESNSEPEIKALTKFILDKKINIYFGFHSAGRDVMGNNNPIAQQLAKTFAKVTGYKFSNLKEWDKLGQTGTAKEWCDELNVAYIEIEASTRWGSDWSNQRAGIEECLKLLSELHT